MEINFNGYQENVLTLACESTVAAGDLVAMSASGTVGKAEDNSAFIGVCLSERDGYAAVQLGGYVEMKKSGTVNLGFTKLVASGDSVKAGSSGKECLVIYSDDTNVGFIL